MRSQSVLETGEKRLGRNVSGETSREKRPPSLRTSVEEQAITHKPMELWRLRWGCVAGYFTREASREVLECRYPALTPFLPPPPFFQVLKTPPFSRPWRDKQNN